MDRELVGLTEQEAARRHARGLGNAYREPTSRPLSGILAANFLSAFNLIVYALATALIAVGLVGDGLLSASMILLNGVIGSVQEVRAKRKLDRIALLASPSVTVIRETKSKAILADEIVQGDVIEVRRGDQIVVDGSILEGSVDVDESMLTGESLPVARRRGEKLLSGSFCVRGVAKMEAAFVGSQSYANRLTSSARAFRTVLTPIQQEINRVIRILILSALGMAFVTQVAAFVHGAGASDHLQSLAVIAGIVPTGLIQSVTVAYLLGALRMARKGVLLQQANAVESMASVTTLCMDKTGTLTTNRLELEDIHSLHPDARKLLGVYAASIAARTETIDGIARKLPGKAAPIDMEIPFTSSLRWGGAAFSGSDEGFLLLGSFEALQPFLSQAGLSELANEWMAQGKRVLMFARHPCRQCFREDMAAPPHGIIPLAILGFKHTLRPHVESTIEEFRSAGVRLKVISGDSPATVRAIASQIGFDAGAKAVSGLDLEKMDDEAFASAAAEGSIFGHVAPAQKERLVDALKTQGNYVAMVGDGVNDVLPLKKAHVGIALGSGCSATRSAADIVLLDDSFAGLPAAVRQGRHVVNGMQAILALYLTRALYTVLLILAAGVCGLAFPFIPGQASVLSILTVGLPAFALIYWAPGESRPALSLKRLFRSFALPAAISIAVFGLATYVLLHMMDSSVLSSSTSVRSALREYVRWAGLGHISGAGNGSTLAARAALTHFTIIAGLFLIVLIQPPVSRFRTVEFYRRTGGNWKPTALVLMMGLLYLLALTIEPIRRLLQFPRYPAAAATIIFLIAAVWAASIHALLKHRVFERLVNA